MGKDYSNQPVNDIRRKDRAVDDEVWIKQFLRVAAVGTLATVHDGQPFINTNIFVYDETAHCIYIHTAQVGRTRSNIDHLPAVCFSIMELGRLLPAPTALEFSLEYAGVTVFGAAEVVKDEAEAIHALQLMLDKYAPHLAAGQDYRPPVAEELKRTSVFCIRIDAWSAKKKEVEQDFAGAFFYKARPVLASNQAR